jgi:signal transduction histidine kinase/sugar phosphate isomerase/epimerase
MKAGFETVIFGRIVDDWPGKLRMIREAGFLGVEIAQSPEMLRLSGIKSYQELRHRVEDADLHLIGLAGGALSKRLKWVGEEPKPDFFYIDDWHEEECHKAMNEGAVLAMHPHLFLKIDTLEDAEKILDSHPAHLWPNLKLLPDTAHLHMTGSNPLEALRKHVKRLAAIHLKDWLPQFGRYSHRYARGFVEPGTGIVKLKEICDVLPSLYPLPDWLIVEVDSTRSTHQETLKKCASWVYEKIPKLEKVEAPADVTPTSNPPLLQPPAQAISLERQLTFRTRIAEASQHSSRSFYGEAADAFAQLIPSHVAQIWIYTPGRDRLNLKGYHRAADSQAHLSLSLLDCGEENNQEGGRKIPLCQQVIAEQVAKAFPLTDPAIQNDFFDRNLLDSLLAEGCEWMISVPICNTWNAHHLRFVINLFPNTKSEEVKAWLSDEKREQFLVELGGLAEALSLSADSMLDERCIYAAGVVHRAALSAIDRQESLDPQLYYQFLVKEIANQIDAEGVSLFLPNEQFQRLECAACEPAPLNWSAGLSDAEKYYFFDKDKNRNAVLAYDKQEMYYFDGSSPTEPKSWESVETQDQHHCIYFPIVSDRLNRTIGVVRCRNRKEKLADAPPGQFARCSMFTDDGAAVLDAMSQAACPTMELLQQQRERIWALNRLNHELDAPVATILACVDMMRMVLNKKGINEREFFGREYIEDIQQWAQIQFRLLQNAEAFRMSFDNRQFLEYEDVNLYTEVVAPVVTQMAYRFRLKGMKHVPITNNLSSLKSIWVDKNWMQLVFFNLLTNAWKYGGAPQNLHITLDWYSNWGNIVLRCTNFGPGIDDKYAEDIFRAGFRDPSAKHQDVTGLGMGLATVLAIAKAHGGTAKLTKGRNPTTFEVLLPSSLLQGPPKNTPETRTLRN